MAKKEVIEELLSEEELKSIKSDIYISGWSSINQVADEVWNSIHSDLLSGDLVFAYKNVNSIGGKCELAQIVIVRNFIIDEFGKKTYTNYSIGEVTSNYSALIPHIPLEYLESEVLSDLENYKIEKKILEAFKQILTNLKNETFSN